MTDNEKANKQRWARTFESIRRAKSWVDNAMDDTIHFKLTHEQSLTAFGRYRETDWYKRLPRWAHSEVDGYLSAIRDSKYSPLYKTLKTGHLYNDKLYRGYDHWRRHFPTSPGSNLTDTCVFYWPIEEKSVSGGKIYFARSTDAQRELHGKWYPLAD